MKKSLIFAFLILVLLVSPALSQTRKRVPLRRSKPKTVSVAKKADQNIVSSSAVSRAVTTPSGLTLIITQHGNGQQLKAGDTVTVNYTGLLANGVKFDSSLDRQEPISFELGAGRVIKGWDEGLQKLRVGDQATLIIPPQIGYGAKGAGGDIPPNATLIFVIEVLGVK